MKEENQRRRRTNGGGEPMEELCIHGSHGQVVVSILASLLHATLNVYVS